VIDQFTVSVVTALVVCVGGVLFLVETLLRRQERAGQLWAVGYLGAILTTLLYLLWAWQPDTWWAVAAGNGAFVVGTGSMWLGCRQFNARSVRWSGLAVAASVVVVAAAAALEGPDGGDWAGALWMFAALAVFAGLACAECFRGELGETGTAVALGLVFGVQSLFYVLRIIVVLTAGVESALFEAALGTLSASALTIILTITSVVCTCILRAVRSGVRGASASGADERGGTALQSADAFGRSLTAVCDKAESRGDLVALTVVRIEELDYIGAAFGLELRDDALAAWRRAAAAAAPTLSQVGELEVGEVAVLSIVDSPSEARREAMALYRAVFEAVSAVTGGVLPAIGVGIALTDGAGYDPAQLRTQARSAAVRAASGLASAVLLFEPR
jgi:GGDEF domain-containing protein